MTILENKLREYNDDTNKPEFTGKSKGTKRSYDRMVEAAKIDATNNPQQKVTSDNAHLIDFIPIREWEAKDRVEDESYGRHNLFR